MTRPTAIIPLLILVAFCAVSCATYKQNIMFKIEDPGVVQQQVAVAEKNYVIQKNDLLQLEVYTNNGERIIDPDLQLTKELGTTNLNSRVVPDYLVDVAGVAKFPMVGQIKIEGLRIREAEEILQKEYSKYYQGAFVILKYVNKRVIVLGSPGGQVIPLLNENMHLVEVLALAKGINNDGKAQNIRVLRNEKVFLVDLSTFDGYLKNNIAIEPGDIVYVEPVRRPFFEGVRDYGILVSLATSISTLVLVIIQ
ncbi:polysaccharide biosynthesis/export family protein [Chryseolinea sp. T2]|uniref:polysaccharide biosynthesis/export family protein n=1 Tax=Chryseolinea sp. T2 TaxID=3129255 RepID=UPI0030784BCD